MPDSFSEVSSKSWFERIKESIKGVLAGVALFVVAFPLLWWNEGRAVQTYKSLVEGASAVVSVAADQVDAANEKKLVHLTGEATTTETMTDQTFAISANAIKLRRTVEMYQWKEDEKRETRKKVGGGEETVTTFTHDKTWSERPINSDEFKKRAGHENPQGMKFSSAGFVADKVTLGAFALSESQIGRLNNFTKLPVDENTLAKLPPDIRQSVIIHSDGYYLPYNPVPPVAQPDVQPPKKNDVEQPAQPATENPNKTNQPAPASDDNAAQPAETQPADAQPAGAQASEATPAAAPLPPSANPSDPQIGDNRISFSVVKPGVVSVIAQQASNSFQPYQTQAGDAMDIIEIGSHSAESMFAAAQAANTQLTWILRVVGFLMMLFGLLLVFKPVVVLADVLPLLGNLLGMGLFAFAAIVAAALSLVTIAIAWLVYRPVLGVALIVVAVAAIVGLIMLGRKRKAAAA